jgi:hypothetical protein
MPDFDFEHLDAKNFERMANALCAEHIVRGLRPFGSGTDGGREATFEGKMAYSAGSEPWDGYLVVQCKQKETRGTPKQEAAWALGQLDAEMKKYRMAKKKRRRPEYFLFITNAHLSAQLDTGGKDKFVERLQHWVTLLNIREADVWDRDKLNNLVDITPKVAQRFGLLHSGNLIHYAANAFLAHQEGIETTLSVFLQKELRADQFVQLAQAGHANDDRTPLARVFVDLRAVSETDPTKDFLVVKKLQQESDRPLHPTLLEEERQAQLHYLRGDLDEEEEEEYEEEEMSEEEEEISGEAVEAFRNLDYSQYNRKYSPARTVIIGGPGQGKSTLGQHLAQRHRAALLKADPTKTLETEINQIIRQVEKAADESGTSLPTYPRWPFRVVLENFAGALAEGKASSVLEYIALLVRNRTKRPFTAQDAELLLTNMPMFVAFDGLDEVPAVSNRAEVLEAVESFLTEARHKDADLLAVATTRPQGYHSDFDKFDFLEFTLSLLSKEEALVYARKFVDVKYAEDADLREKIMQRLEVALSEEAIARLMRSPLQVTIMIELVVLIGILPRERYTLFERYYEIIYQREQGRGLTLSTVLADYRKTIEILHDRIGLLLQVEAESKGNTSSRISGKRLTQMVHDYLVQKEHEGEELTNLTASFMEVALNRLVFIVPLEDDRYGFEVRSLQEFSAARALMRGEYSIVKKRLRAIAPILYWRNTTLFAIGQAFAKQNEQEADMVIQLCHELNDNEDPLLFRTLAGSRLALDVLEDGIVELQPDYRRKFIKLALQVVYLPHEATASRLVPLYTSREEAQYKKEVQAAVGSSEEDGLIGPFAVLVGLAPDDSKAAWARPLLHKLWPTALGTQQLLLKGFGRRFEQDEWFKEVATNVAIASSLAWVSGTLANFVELAWIRDVSQLRIGRRRKALLKGRKPVFYYNISLPTGQQEILDRLQRYSPTTYDWLPFTLGRAFMLNPSPETLADCIEALVHEGGWEPGRTYHWLPWQLPPLLEESQSPEELLRYAQRARAGELGTTQDWLAAEQRWANQKFTIEDLTAFSDAEWPYTSKIAKQGIIPMGSYGLTKDDYIDADATLSILEAFSKSTSVRYRPYIAMSLLFVVSNTYDPDYPFTLPLDTIEQIVTATDWQVYALDMLALFDPDLEWVEEVKSLDALGNRISVLGDQDGDFNIQLQKETMPYAVEQLVPLVGKKKVREGILRFLAAFAVAGAEVPVPDLDPATLSMDGRVALVTLNLFSTAPVLSGADLKQLVVSIGEYKHPSTQVVELPRVLYRLVEQDHALTPAAIDVLDGLYATPEVSVFPKLLIIRSLINQIQYRTSGLADPARKTELGTDWLFDVLN